MRIINAKKIKETVEDLCIKANILLRNDVLVMLKNAYRIETNKRAKRILQAIIDNAAIARRDTLAICQDTGLPIVFVELGQEVKIDGDLIQSIHKGIAQGYRRGSFRESIIRDPLLRARPGYAPAIIHIDVVKGNRLKISVLPKGFGSENKSQLMMFNPTAGIAEIIKFVVDAVKSAGPDACPPYVVGVGIGGTADYASLLAKKALLKPIGRPTESATILERDLFRQINRLNIGPMGLGGKATCLGVNIESAPTHIAGLPVAINISCHALRSATKTI